MKCRYLAVITLIVFVLAQVPANAIAALRVRPCGMACCLPRSVENETAKTPGCCAIQHAMLSAHSLDSFADSCKCELKLGTPNPQQSSYVAVLNLKVSDHDVVADVTAPVLLDPSLSLVNPGIVGQDSDPPGCHDSEPSRGRAPPVVI